MCKVFTEILPCGVLPALSQHISRFSDELGIFENQMCLGCFFESLPAGTEWFKNFELLFQILPILRGQNFFQTLTTRMVESALLRVAWNLSSDSEYVCICI